MNGLTNLVNNVDLSALTDKASDAQAQVSALQSKGTEAAQNLSSIKDSVSGILGLFK
jgi:capsule polysaccharide export protein KpsE/RkpR